MGMGASNTLGRIASSFGGAGPVDPHFESCLDVPNGGVLFALPALLVVGLLRHTKKYFQEFRGYYGLLQVFLLLAFMALARQKFIEKLRFEPPGEWGNLLGLDRVPEPKILREKIAQLSKDDTPKQWAAELSKDWMEESSEEAATLYIDGHIRRYHGKQTKLPKHYLSRDKLCARAEADYWVNALGGKPFFKITKVVDPGLQKTLLEEIIPRLEKDIPDQPTQAELEADPFLYRFICVFDREGYSPKNMYELWKKRIACITYNKYQGEDWPIEEFEAREITLQSGEVVKYKLAERFVFKKIEGKEYISETSNIETVESFYKKSNEKIIPGICYIYKKQTENGVDKLTKMKGVWFREIRKIKDNGKQTSILSTNYKDMLDIVSFKMFSRWSQENYFRYMNQHYGLNRVIDSSLEEMCDTTPITNPSYRQLESEIRKLNSKLTYKKSEFASIILEGNIGDKDFLDKEYEKSKILEKINDLTERIEELKKEKKSVKQHINFHELPEDSKFKGLNSKSKHFIDTIKMIAYRAETANINILKEAMSKYAKDESRSLMRAIYNSSADLIVDNEKQILTIKLHHLANKNSDQCAEYFCKELNELKMKYPGTNLQLVYQLLSSNLESVKKSDRDK